MTEIVAQKIARHPDFTEIPALVRTGSRMWPDHSFRKFFLQPAFLCFFGWPGSGNE